MRLSSRLPQGFEPNALTAALTRLRAQGREVLDLTVSNPTRCGFTYPEAEIRQALSQPTVLAYDPDPQGARAAREAIAAHHGHGLRAENLLLTASTSEGYGLLFKLLGDPGDEVLVPSPSYPLFEWLARLEGLLARPVPSYFHDRWHLDLGALEAAVSPRTRAVVVVNPNNPTGHFLTKAEWAALTSLCARYGLALLVDEVFADYALEPAGDRMATALLDPDPPCPVFLLSGLSKVAALPQLKLGWIAGRGPGAAAGLEALAFLADQYLSVSAPVQAAAPRLLELARPIRAQILERLQANLTVLDAALAGQPPLSRLPVEGGWSVLLRRPAVDADEACALRLLEEASVLIYPGSFFDLPGDGHLVLSLLTGESGFSEGLHRIFPWL
ncbi:MAG: pyridoxal phosphate-dependent aminotransferase [Geothrix sp.]|uniref:pyridoxal phosphate-dependent aminotransferase n=1 Tax=Geothrix sp. TaxID=1962974 RepID=UPI00184FA0F7|nr:pyridoxal phosphate-dependent aminotransferase [Geothrix sp.]NWJ42414.1 pyridoxal phosphate-dependent aminotransferase [Geothrix sp.]WIL19620.1 MAG: pyridoxal phosphate-dependent aminotransferase [Geothrix sp.]